MRKSTYKLSMLLLMCFSILTMQGTVFGAGADNAYDSSVIGLSVTLASSKLTVGQTVHLNVALQYDDGTLVRNPDGLHISVDKPHILKLLANNDIKIAAVGEASISVEGAGQRQSVKVSASAKDPLEGAKVIKDVSYLPLTPVITALGGTVKYDAPTKNYSIQVGKTSIAIARGTAKAKVDGKAIEMKGAPIVDNGQTLFTADLLTKALGAALKWDSANNRIIVSMGAGQLIVNGEKPKVVNSTSMYEVAATGKMAGWKLLKGHPYEKSIRIYFIYKQGILSVKTEDIRTVNLNQKVTWTDDAGRKHVNTVRDIYGIFSYSNQYTSDWLYATFGDLYYDWLASSSIDPTQVVEEYLTASGQMEAPKSYVTLTPDAVFE